MVETNVIVLTLKAVLLTNVVQFSKFPSVLERFCLVAGHPHIYKGLHFCFMEDFNMD